ncbi:MAG: hypothetical protein ABSG05_00235 [Candidatus Pacearchaeota archaeon]|jgi:hypothetical protein
MLQGVFSLLRQGGVFSVGPRRIREEIENRIDYFPDYLREGKKNRKIDLESIIKKQYFYQDNKYDDLDNKYSYKSSSLFDELNYK